MLDSGYMLHMIQDGVQQGVRTLQSDTGVNRDGTNSTDKKSWFSVIRRQTSPFSPEFENNVLIVNPRLTGTTDRLASAASPDSRAPCLSEKGFVERLTILVKQAPDS